VGAVESVMPSSQPPESSNESPSSGGQGPM
jgi:hypothetical protein